MLTPQPNPEIEVACSSFPPSLPTCGVVETPRPRQRTVLANVFPPVHLRFEQGAGGKVPARDLREGGR